MVDWPWPSSEDVTSQCDMLCWYLVLICKTEKKVQRLQLSKGKWSRRRPLPWRSRAWLRQQEEQQPLLLNQVLSLLYEPLWQPNDSFDPA